MARIIFYTHAPVEKLSTVEFYRQDIEALKALGHEVIVCTKLREIPFRFDAMFVWWWTRALPPVMISRLLNKPCIVTGTFDFRFPDSFKGVDYFRRPYWQKILIRLAAKYCTLNLFVNQVELEQCSKYFGLKKVGYMPHCVADEYLKGPSAKRVNALFNVAWSGKQNLVRKGIPELLKAVRILKDRGREVEVFLAGLEGDGRAWLLEMIEQLQLHQAVHYLGSISRDEKIRMLRENEIYVQPSHYEGFGVAILESMGCGGCVVVRDVGGVREVVGDCGIYAKSSHPEDLAIAIETALEDRPLRSRLQQDAVGRAKALFTFDQKVHRLGKFLGDLGIQ